MADETGHFEVNYNFEPVEQLFDMSTVASLLDIKDFGRTKLFEYLKKKEILKNDNTPYDTYRDKGYFKLKTKNRISGREIDVVTLTTLKGLNYIIKKLKQDKLK